MTKVSFAILSFLIVVFAFAGNSVIYESVDPGTGGG